MHRRTGDRYPVLAAIILHKADKAANVRQGQIRPAAQTSPVGDFTMNEEVFDLGCA
jgi:hypothetical protein